MVINGLTKTLVSSNVFGRLLEVPCWFKASLSFTFCEFCPCQVQKIILCAVRFNLHKVRLNIENFGKTQKTRILSFTMFSSISGEKDNFSEI